MKIRAMIGYKLFKELEDGSLHMIRITWVNRYLDNPREMKIFDYKDNTEKKVKIADYSDYNPLKPDGIFTIAIAEVMNSKGKLEHDVLATITHFDMLKAGLNVMPYAVCRQNISDVFYNILTDDEHNQLVGVSISQDTCPANFDYGIMFAADSIKYDEFINFYLTDTLDDIYKLIDVRRYNEVLRDSFLRHVKITGDMKKSFQNEDQGWCKDLKTLFEINNFQVDINAMLGITAIDFKLEDFCHYNTIPNTDTKYLVADDDLRDWLSYQYKTPITEASILKYDHDIDLHDFDKARYILIRDITNTLYLIVYTIDGEFFEEDLKRKVETPDFSTKFKLKYYNKYNSYNKNLE